MGWRVRKDRKQCDLFRVVDKNGRGAVQFEGNLDAIHDRLERSYRTRKEDR